MLPPLRPGTERGPLTLDGNPLYSGRIHPEAGVVTMEEVDLKTLEFRVNELIQLCERLREENRSLRAQQAHLTAERATLIEKNEQARSQVEGILTRLKSLERE